jgi:hypothetical protein
MGTPTLSVVVVAHNMDREVRRTLYSLSADYQRHIARDDYEVIVVDNGSDMPVDAAIFAELAGNFRLIRIDPAPASPAPALNRGLAAARGEIVGLMTDGARIATPGLLHFARHGARLFDRAVVATLGWYLGHDLQGWAITSGYDRAREDALLDSVDWKTDGYRLFEVGTMDESSLDGWFQPIAESNALFLRRATWELLGGVDERFRAPGGGLMNLDTFRRALELPDAELVILLGEATFHQLHGGVNTNAAPERQQRNWETWSAEYASLQGRPYEVVRPKHPPVYIGTLPKPALQRMARAALHPAGRALEPPLGAEFDPAICARTTTASSAGGTVAELVALARNELAQGRIEASCGVARLIHQRAPEQHDALRLLSLVASSVPLNGPPAARRAEYHLALGEAYRILGEDRSATSHFRAALVDAPDLPQAHLALSALRMPGDGYLKWLERLYAAMAPETLIEVGVFQGASLTLARPSTVAIGIDPNPAVVFPLKTQTHIFTETSDAFFARGGAAELLAGRPLSVAFIDGLHRYEQALRDFINVEALCGPRSMVILHDTVPLDEPTQRRTQETVFYTGDVWKIVPCLKHYRPDLDVFTIATPPTGLTVVTGLNPASHVLREKFDEAVALFIDMPFAAIESDLDAALGVVPNDWDAVWSRIEQRRVPDARAERVISETKSIA